MPPEWLRGLLPGALWRVSTLEKRVYLTFDDGPVPGITPWVLEQLQNFGFKATFFCVADNVRKYPRVFSLLQKAGMEVGTHTYSHQPGYKMSLKAYLKDIEKASTYLPGTSLFRPPHGIIRPWWLPVLKKHFKQVVMWDVLSRDYDRSLTPKMVADGVLRSIRPGSIVVFHDSLKAWPNLKTALPKVLQWLKENDYTCALLKEAQP